MTTDPAATPPPEPAFRAAPDRRLHTAAVALRAWSSLRDLLVPLAFLIVLGASRGGLAQSLLYGVIGLVAALAMGIARWATTAYRVSPDGIWMRSGLLSPDEHQIPRSRITSIDVVQGPIHRLFGVVELRVQTPGGGKGAEIELSAVSPSEAAEIRALLGHAREPAPADARFRLGGRMLLLTAVSGPQAGVLIPVVAGLGALAQQAGPDEGTVIVQRLPHGAGEIVLAVAVVAVLALLLSVAGALIAFGGFEARREGGRVRITRGLLNRRTSTIALGRVHAVRIVENPFRQPLGLVAIRIATVAHGEQPAAAQTLVPLARRGEARAIVAGLVPGLEPDDAPLSRPPRRAARRYVTPWLLASLAVSAVIVAIAASWWPAAAVLVLAAVAFGLLRHHDAGWTIDAGRVTIRERELGRSTLIARTTRLQAEDLRRSLTQRRAGLATLRITVAAGRRASVAHLELPVAGAVFERLRAGAAALS